MPSWTYDLTVLILFHLKAFELILFRFLLFFFLISRIFQILLNVVDTVITCLLYTSVPAGKNKVKISWDKVEDAEGYIVYRLSLIHI